MNRNVAVWDRALRVALGVLLLALAVAGPKTAWGPLGVVQFITGAMGICPIYCVLGITSFGAGHRELLAH